MIIAIDFDGTIVYNEYPNIGTLKPHAKEIINTLYERGHKILIWTCRTRLLEHQAIEFLKEEGIKFHYCNNQLPEVISEYGNDVRKLSYDVLIDDRNLGGIPDDWREIWYKLIEQFEERL